MYHRCFFFTETFKRASQSGTDVSYVSDCYAFACYISLAPIRKGHRHLIGMFCSI